MSTGIFEMSNFHTQLELRLGRTLSSSGDGSWKITHSQQWDMIISTFHRLLSCLEPPTPRSLFIRAHTKTSHLGNWGPKGTSFAMSLLQKAYWKAWQYLDLIWLTMPSTYFSTHTPKKKDCSFSLRNNAGKSCKQNALPCTLFLLLP